MAQGQERIERTQDSLRGAEAVQPVTRNVPGISAPATPSMPVDSFGNRMNAKLGQFAAGKLAEAQQRRQELSIRDGQIAAMQGKSFEEVEMGGDKWALEGYRVVTAQTMSAGLFNAQQQEIQSGAYEKDPDDYRGKLMSRMEEMTAGITDPRTRELVQEQIMSQMPQLVDQHMKSNLAFKEQQNFDAIAGSLDTLSKDPNSNDALVGFAMGTNGATTGLSEARRKEAVVQGLINSFSNGNPAAYAKLEAAGFFNTTNLSAAQINQVESAKNSYHAKMENEYNQEWTIENERINDLSKDPEGPGELRIVELRAQNNAKHWRRNTQQELGQDFANARQNREYNEGSRGMLIEAAKTRKDYGKQAGLMMDALVHQESRGNGKAVSPKGARGLTQVMPATAMSPGFGLPNVFEVADSMGISYSGRTQDEAERLLHNDALNLRYGERYLQTMLTRYEGNETAALAAYNMGPGNVDKWLANGGNVDDLNAETKHYVKVIQSNWRDDIPDPNGTRVIAEAELKSAREGAAAYAYENAMPVLDQLDADYRSGKVDRQTWVQERRDTMAQWGMAVDREALNHEAQINRSVISATEAKVEAATATANEIALADDLRVLNEQYGAATAAAKSGDPVAIQQVAVLSASMIAQRQALFAKHNVTPTAAQEIAYRDGLNTSAKAAITEGNNQRVLRAERGRAITDGTLGALPVDQQKAAMADFDKALNQKYTNLIASQNANGNTQGLTPEAIGAAMSQERNQFLAQSGMIDDKTKRVMNSGLEQPMMLDGKVNPAYVEAANAFMQMNQVSPHVAEQYLDPANKGPLYAIAGRVGTAGNMEAAVQAYAVATENKGNAPYRTPEEFMNDPGVHSRIDSQIRNWVKTTDPFRNAWFVGLRDEANDTRYRGDFDQASVSERMTEVLTQEVADIQKYHPNLSADAIIPMAAETVKRRYAVVGNETVDFGRGSDAYSVFFGNRAEEMRGKDDAINTAIVNYITTPEFQAQYPQAVGSSFGEWTGLSIVGRGAQRVGSWIGLADTPTGNVPGGPLSSIRDAVAGYNPYNVIHMPNGRGGTSIMLQFEDAGGWSEPIEIDPQVIGAAELKRIRERQ